ncbi:MAG: hypothetical protein ABSA54_06730 [Terriglobales bacterium]
MSQTSINYKSVLADLIARRAKLDAAIAAIEEFAGHDGNDVGSATQSKPTILPLTREYRGMTIADATIKFLKTMGKPQATGDIARALKLGGIGSASKNMYRTVYNTLNSRLDKHQDITKEGAKWGLAEWKTQ